MNNLSSDNKLSGMSVVCPKCAVPLHVGVLPDPVMTQSGDSGWWFECGQCRHRWWHQAPDDSGIYNRAENLKKLQKIMQELDDKYQQGPSLLLNTADASRDGGPQLGPRDGEGPQFRQRDGEDPQFRQRDGDSPQLGTRDSELAEESFPKFPQMGPSFTATDLPNADNLPNADKGEAPNPEENQAAQTYRSATRMDDTLSYDGGFNDEQLALILKDPRNKEIFEGKIGSDFFPKKKW
ncbi:MAG: hypothetical protein LBR89_01205, partial [Holosporales bacterium]|nr:hypothetical protein [Holosporales bacterium]